MTYRPAVDGLRAVAVLSVVLYHFGFPGPAGGFVGVDVFFVISGYLIGGLLWQELTATGRLRLGRFWLRRVRRLAPAFFVMAAATAAVAWVVLLPFEFREFGKEMIAATVWLSNVLFWRDAGYFDPGAANRPFLHTWSLSVEEQFYIALPLVLLALARWRWGLPAVLALLWAGSLAACVILTPAAPTAAFYLFPFRAWELLTGVLLAILTASRPDRRGPPWAAMAGLALILAALVLARPDSFPGWQAIAPVAGTALVLWARDDGPVARLLAHPAPVFVGLISYALYLWHWPVLVLSTYARDGFSGWPEALGWMALAFVLATLAWALVERPIRRSARIGPPALLGGFATAATAALAFGAVVWRGDGLPARFGPEARTHIAASQDFLQDWSRCTTPADGPFAGVETCAIGPDGPPQVVIWGDSHLRALMDGLAVAADTAAVPGVIVWHAGCPPLDGVTKQETAATPAQDAACAAATARTLTAIETLRPARLILVGRWTYYASGTGIGRDAHNLIRLMAADTTAPQANVYAAAWQATIARLAPAVGRIAVFRQVPELPDHDSRSLARGLVAGRLTAAEADSRGTLPPAALAARIAPAEAPIAALAASGAIDLIDPWPAICTPDCRAVHDGQGWYFDNNHLTNAGAVALAPLFVPMLRGAAGD